ncbi:MAG TPA: MBOAT family O-acyltransferase [Verrucomicrobiae bacterium]|nr:MBOAT family O-acyltransferase [Verrucomicrobiae bacterium]
MLFNSWQFFVFLAVVLALYYSLATLPQNRMLLVASYFFYGWWDWRFTSLLMISTIFDFHISIAIDNASNPRRRKLLLLASILVNFGMLGFFKYFNFFIDSAAHVIQWFGLQPHLPVLRIILPAGISFYTFQTMNYVIDVYNRKMKPTTDFLTYALFVSYFPHLVAGPIIRAEVLLPQLLRKRIVTNEHLNTGGALILIGLFKKVVIADVLSPDVQPFFTTPHAFSSLLLLKGLYYFSLQIYCDFSGYTDIARGVSRLLGIELPENFNQPYLSRNITEFWRRWHISLSTWLRDYLYIPLGGNRRGRVRTYINLFITMLLGGLWHGANWTFVAWGFLHGLYLAAHKFYLEVRSSAVSVTSNWLTNALKVFVTFHLVALT